MLLDSAGWNVSSCSVVNITFFYRYGKKEKGSTDYLQKATRGLKTWSLLLLQTIPEKRCGILQTPKKVPNRWNSWGVYFSCHSALLPGIDHEFSYTSGEYIVFFKHSIYLSLYNLIISFEILGALLIDAYASTSGCLSLPSRLPSLVILRLVSEGTSSF